MMVKDAMQEYFEKLAARRESAQGKYEAALAERAKNGDVGALKELTERLMPLIDDAVRSVGYNSMISPETLRAEAVNIAQHYIPQYSPDKGASVGTYIRGNVGKKLQTYIQENTGAVRYQGHLLSVVPKVRSVMSYLDGTIGAGKYGPKDIHKEMVSLYGRSDKWNINNIERIVGNVKPENIGDRSFGEEGVGQELTLMDSVNIKENPMDDLAETLEVNRIHQAARRVLTPEEYSLFDSYLKGQGMKGFKKYRLALDFNLSTQDLDKKLKDIRNKVNKEL